MNERYEDGLSSSTLTVLGFPASTATTPIIVVFEGRVNGDRPIIELRRSR